MAITSARLFTIVYLSFAILFVVHLVGKLAFGTVILADEFIILMNIVVFGIEAYKNGSEVRSQVGEMIRDNPLVGEMFTVSSSAVVLVRASWCSACKKYTQSGSWDALRATGAPDTHFYAYDIDTDRDTLRSLGIDAAAVRFVPTVFVVRNGVATQFQGNVYDNNAILATLGKLKYA